ncbi:erythrocyte membrane protein 1, PfEMP1, putative [Plasmodium sp.]|nr:erythrocyte membrane protein 1, PfEMP1, putative [Plasmodium sp.]
MGGESSKHVPTVFINESDKSTRNVLEYFAQEIKKQAQKDAESYVNSLKGNLKRAKFYHPFFKIKNYIPEDPCYLDFAFHSNTPGNRREYRHPCARNMKKNLSSLEGALCTNSKIKGNEKKINGAGACAPYRRRHICDLNLEHIDVHNVQNIHDLLGNILVTAKYEGESIVKSHENNGPLNVCTALARSFADIGDIVRGKDLFLGKNESEIKTKEKLQGNLENIFEKIRKNNRTLKNLSIGQVREAWWSVNRQQVWNAITCSAPYEARYFIKSSTGKQSFSDEHCGHNKNDDPLTNLDYVPQFLRWFEEWAEHFCPVRRYKLEKVKEACRGNDDKKYCSVDGYDCKRTDREKNIFYVNLECPGCEKECRSYKKWIENQEQEFNKQKIKYNNEIKNVESKSVNTYDETFYKNLKTNYSVVENFLETLKEGSQCKTSDAKHEIDFTKPEGIFSRSEYCKACPILGLKCDETGKCVPNKENDEHNKIGVDKGNNTAISTEIPILLNDGATNSIDKDLKTCSKKYSLFKNIRKQEWACQYLNGIDHCTIKNIENHIDVDKNIKFKEFFERWLKYFIQDFNKIKDEINRCTNIQHGKDKICIKGCKNKCECVEKWIEKKDVEWKKIKQHYNQQKQHNANIVPRWVNSFLTHELFSRDFINALEAFDSIRSLINLNKCNDEKCKINKIKNINEDLITYLLENLKKKIPTCKSQNDDSNGKKCCIDMPKIADGDEDEEDGDEPSPPTPPPTTNACVKSSGVDTTKTVTDVAKILHEKAKYRSSDISKLKAHAENGTYNRKGNSQDFKGLKLCQINERNSNADDKSKYPCNGKNIQRFNIGKDWSDLDKKQKSSYTDVYLPQRREHMCTSNLEYLQTNKNPLNGSDSSVKGRSKINDSFLGDILLAAKFEADKIKELYEPTSDHESVCRAVSRSFADIGDIIKGTDMWDKDRGSTDMETRLKKIFKKIKEKHDGIKDNPKYTDKDKFLDLRSDWWEANRAKVWEAMQCAIKDFNTSTGYCQYKSCDRVPLDDYIPQRLRWMTEWAEWFCKMQKEEYDKLVTGCDKCWSKGGGKQCMNGDDECKTCKEACAKYKTKIETWKKQWEKISNIYKILYKIAAIDVGVGFPSYYSVHEKDKHVIEFLKKLHTQNGGDKSDTVYSTAEGYVHQEATMNCEKQHVFCEKKNGVKPAKGAEDNEYAFRNYPNGYDDACACENNQKPVPVPKKQEEDACQLAQDTLKDKNAYDLIENCKPKNYRGIAYPGWDCDKTKFEENQEGACMPPRRQKLCIKKLAQGINGEKDLRTAFIKCAAIETYFSWHYYKSKNGNVETKLQNGTIPPEFLRSMFYTFGDYRDFLFGTDISKKHSGKDMEKVRKNIDKLFQNGLETNNTQRQKWWNENGPYIWKGILCALEKAGGNTSIKSNLIYDYETVTFDGTTKLDDFAKRPQFLRWMMEWGEEFCRTRKEKVKELEEKCAGCKVSDNVNGESTKTCEKNSTGCQNCTNACKEYELWLRKWKENYQNQSKKYFDDKAQGKYNDNPSVQDDVISSSHAYEYLKRVLPKDCTAGTCFSCMEAESIETKSKTDNKSHNSRMPASLDDEPEEVKGRCTCQKAPQPPAQSNHEHEDSKDENHQETQEDDKHGSEDDTEDVATQEDEVYPCDIVKTLFDDKPNLEKACEQKYGSKSRLGWKCVARGEDTSTGGSICVPPRRRRLYVGKLETLDTDSTSQNDGKTASDKLRTAFIQSAAVETFFLWHKFKKEWELRRAAPQPGGLVGNGVSLASQFGISDGDESDDPDPHEELKKGIIPEEFKRQMFYTLGDYRDICVGVKDDVVEVLKASGDKKIEELQNKIKEHLNSGDTSSRTTPGQKSGDEQRKAWWEKYGPSIWNGMICALTYKESDGTNNIEKNNDVYKKFFGENGTPGNAGAFKEKYDYNTVKLKEEVNGAMPTGPNAATSTETTLTSFVTRPAYFRWLEEWGESFCRQKTRMLKDVKDNCRTGIYGNRYSDGDGFNCEQIGPNKENILKTFDYVSCPKSCTLYKMWITKKRTEYEKQEKVYGQQKFNAEKNNDGKEFYKNLLGPCITAGDFLERLKKGPCITENENEKDIIDFSQPKQTFKEAHNCGPCSEFTVKCENVHCGGASNGKECNGGKITAQNFKDKTDFIKDVVMRVSDNDTNKFDDLQVCQTSGIFKGIRKDEWKCGKVCGLYVCKPENVKEDEDGKNQIILINALVKRWVEHFLKDYNKIKKKLKPCMNGDKGNICIKTCVEKWIKEKREEWKTIRELYLKKYESEDSDIPYDVRRFLNEDLFDSDIKKAIGPCENLEQFQNSTDCTVAASSQGRDANKKDIVECLLDKIETKAKNCPNKSSGENQAQTCENSTPTEDEDDEQTLEDNEENEKTNIQPGFCPPPTQQQDEGEEKCEEAKPPGTVNDVKEEEEEKEEEKDKGDEESGSPPAVPAEPEQDPDNKEALPTKPEEPPPKVPEQTKENKKRKRRPKPPQIVYEHPLLKPALMSSTIMWSVGISFAAISYFLLKKKSKSSVDLLRVLNIPKGEYEMPTLKSKNRYIPYRSDSYKGKTYIYMEGDTSGDEDKYIWDLSSSDITSSESEYEEMDINDIYVPGSPKYKTLIEVVLEPSKRDTPSNDIQPTNRFTDEEWSELKHDFISQYLPNTEPNTLYFDKPEEKPFITSIHDRDLYTGEQINYNINMVNNHIPMSDKNDTYSGIDLINDSLSGEPIDIYDEVLKRKENELFGTKHPKRTSNNSVAINTNSDPIDNQLNLFNTWLDRHRNMCEQWNTKEDILNKLNEEWNKDNDGGNVPSDNRSLNTDASIQIDMDHKKPKKEFTNMDTNMDTPTMDNILDDLETYNEPFYDIYEDDVYYDVNDDNKTSSDHNNLDVSSKVQIEMDVNTKLVKEKYPIADVWDI